jgi:hypothetical protein
MIFHKSGNVRNVPRGHSPLAAKATEILLEIEPGMI